MRCYFVYRSSQNRSPPSGWVSMFIVRAYQLGAGDGLFLPIVSSMSGRCGRKFIHKENEKWL
jgi:hypothetical protein